MLSLAHDGEKQQSDGSPLSIEEPVQRKRLYYLDWLRVLAVLGVFVAHTGDIFDTLYWHTRQGGGGMSSCEHAPTPPKWAGSSFTSNDKSDSANANRLAEKRMVYTRNKGLYAAPKTIEPYV